MIDCEVSMWEEYARLAAVIRPRRPACVVVSGRDSLIARSALSGLPRLTIGFNGRLRV